MDVGCGGGGCRSMTRHGPIVMYFSGLNTQMHHSWEHLGILSPWDIVRLDIVLHGFLSLWGVVPLGFCPPGLLSHLDVVPLGFCPYGILSSWVFVFLGFFPLGYCPMGFCPVGFCPRTRPYTPSNYICFVCQTNLVPPLLYTYHPSVSPKSTHP